MLIAVAGGTMSVRLSHSCEFDIAGTQIWQHSPGVKNKLIIIFGWSEVNDRRHWDLLVIVRTQEFILIMTQSWHKFWWLYRSSVLSGWKYVGGTHVLEFVALLQYPYLKHTCFCADEAVCGAAHSEAVHTQNLICTVRLREWPPFLQLRLCFIIKSSFPFGLLQMCCWTHQPPLCHREQAHTAGCLELRRHWSQSTFVLMPHPCCLHRSAQLGLAVSLLSACINA